MPGGVFINYRSEDSFAYGALLHLALSQRFGADLVFLDSASIQAGADFVAELLGRVRRAGVVLAVIGPRWLAAAGHDGRRRIDDPADWIRRELMEAFKARKRVIPVLTDDARMPTEDQLPTDLAALGRCQYRRLRHRDAYADLERLIKELAASEPDLAAAAAAAAQWPLSLVQEAAADLAYAVTVQWGAEAGLRGLYWPAPLPLTWGTTDRRVHPPPGTVADPQIPGRVLRLRWHDHGEIAEKFLALPDCRRRLVVLGAPGGGKTVLAMLLTLELLKRRKPDDPVPVLLGLSSWDPTDKHLRKWLACRLGEDYPALTNLKYGKDVPQRLIKEKLVLPVLDGLDELPEPLRATAIAELVRSRPDAPLVVTCRSQEYKDAVTAGGGVLPHTTTVELQPVATAQAIDYLQTAAAPNAERWGQVAAHLRNTPTGALATTLSSPLMVALARTIYTSPGRNPNELLGIAQGGGQPAIERHLLDGFIPAAYATRPPDPDAPKPRQRRPPDPEQARRWLALLASLLNQRNTRDLRWWQLPNLIHQRTLRLVIGPLVGLVVGLVAALMVGVVSAPSDGLLAGLAVGPLFGAAFGAALAVWPLTPTRVDIRIWRRHRDRSAESERIRIERAAEVAAVVGRAVGRAVGRTIRFGLTGIMVLVLAFWIHKEGVTNIRNWLHTEAAEIQNPPPDLFMGAMFIGMMLYFILLIAFLIGRVLFGGGAGLVIWIMESLRSPADEMRAVTPRSVLADDRAAALVLGFLAVLVSAAAGGFCFGILWLIGTGLDGLMGSVMFGGEVGLMFGVVGGLVGTLGYTAWGQFTIVRTWLTIRGKLPWRLMTFLADAHNRNVLRHAGAVYQFRHAQLQDHLADINRPSQQPDPTGNQLPTTNNPDTKTSLTSHAEFKESLRRKPTRIIAAFCFIFTTPVLTVFYFMTLPERTAGDIFRSGLADLGIWCFTAHLVAKIALRSKLTIDRNGLAIRNYTGGKLDRARFPWNELLTVKFHQRYTERVLVCTPKPGSILLVDEYAKKLWSDYFGGYVVIDVTTLRGGPHAVSAALSQYSGGRYRSHPDV